MLSNITGYMGESLTFLVENGIFKNFHSFSKFKLASMFINLCIVIFLKVQFIFKKLLLYYDWFYTAYYSKCMNAIYISYCKYIFISVSCGYSNT